MTRPCWEVAPGLFTDLYQLTMAQGYHLAGIEGREACFYVSFREHPFGGGFTLLCGIEQVAEYLQSLSFSAEEIAFLASRTAVDGSPLFAASFLDRLAGFEFDCDVDAIPEGTVVFPGEPVVRVSGPIASCQLVETALLNIVNFQTLVATKAARVVLAAAGDPVVEFGLRRAQGPDGGLSASRAAYIGGCAGTSNTLAAHAFGVPAVGTHAHSWVMAFDSEREAFEAYADSMPNNVTLLVDTYDTLQGVRSAAEVGIRLKAEGRSLLGIRIDSGDLAWLSQRAREILDEAGLTETRIVASNELDEYLIMSLKDQGAAIDVWGVGTKLVTAFDQPALGGVYKLSAMRAPSGEWVPRIKVSEQTAKVTTPGVLGVRRYVSAEGAAVGDMIHDVSRLSSQPATMIDPADSTRRKSFAEDHEYRELMEPLFRRGERVTDPANIQDVRAKAAAEIGALDKSRTRLLNPHGYPVGLETSVYETRRRLILEARGVDDRVDPPGDPDARVGG